MGILSILALLFVAVTLILVLADVKITQKWINVLLLIIALLVVLSGANLHLRL